MKNMIRVWLLLASAASCGRGKSECVIIASSIQLLEQPYPIGYPSSQPVPNKVLTMLAPGRYTTRKRVDGMDFRAYAIDSGQFSGFVIDDSRIRSCEEGH